MYEIPKEINMHEKKQFRIIPSVYPPINFFEDLVDTSEMETLWEIESITNDRIRQEVGDIYMVAAEDRISGPGSSVVMASFTHIHAPSRFTDGSFGIYYAGLSPETAIRETVFHREKFLSSTKEDAMELTMRLYEGKVIKPLHDIRNSLYNHLHHLEDYQQSQLFGREMRNNQSWGLIYNSVRHAGGLCIAAFKPKTISIPQAISHLKYVWNGKKIVDVLSIDSVLSLAE